MEKRNTLLLTVIAIATLLVAVVGATFAYFASTVNTDVNSGNFNTTTNIANGADAQKVSFLAVGKGAIDIQVTDDMMQQHYAGDGNNTSSDSNLDNKFKGNASINVSLDTTGTSAEKGYECYYDLVWTWSTAEDNKSSDDFSTSGTSTKVNGQKIYPSKYYVRTQPTDELESQHWSTGFKELTVSITSTAKGTVDTYNTLNGSAVSVEGTTTQIKTDVNIDEFNALEGDKIVLLDDQHISSHGSKVDATYDVTVKFYNLNHNQSALKGKNFVAVVSVDNVRC